jgi:hypothetical protein
LRHNKILHNVGAKIGKISQNSKLFAKKRLTSLKNKLRGIGKDLSIASENMLYRTIVIKILSLAPQALVAAHIQGL